jgi:hypothetical protein
MTTEPKIAAKMPDPWFIATTHASVIRGGLDRGARAPHGGERVLAGFLLPDWQRPRVWTPAQNVRFIESIWYDLPIGSYVVNADFRSGNRFDNYLIDGQQRWSAIADYLADHYTVFGERYSDLSVLDKRRFGLHVFPCVETKLTSEAELKEIYDRLAYGGTPHDLAGRPGS